MKTVELVFIPAPGMGHLISTMEMAKILVNREDQLSITVLIIKLPKETNIPSYTKFVSSDHLRLLELPPVTSVNMDINGRHPLVLLSEFINSYKCHVKDAVNNLFTSSTKLAGFVVDMFCTSMIDVANEFGVPSYVFYTSGAATLGLQLHFEASLSYLESDESEVEIPTYVNPVPVKCLPGIILGKDETTTVFLNHAKRFREARGIMVNSFVELESHALKVLSDDEKTPQIYSVGPILNLGGGKDDQVKWLDEQPNSSVVFLCFGSMGSFEEDQVKEIATALENSGCTFLWSLRQPPPKGKLQFPGEFDSLEAVLPEGFLQRCKGRGKVIGWAPQVEILSHRAVGGFVSHCGWNSTLESVRCGVPMATWPLYAEQQCNAFQLVKDLEMAVEIKLDYQKDNPQLVKAEEIENGIRQLMDSENKIRAKVTMMKEKSKAALMEGGSSYIALGNFIDTVMKT